MKNGQPPVTDTATWRVCGGQFDPAQRALVRGGERQTLSPPVSRLLELLLQHAGRPLEREWLLEQAWNGADVSDESLSKAISTLRRTLDDPGHNAIETLHGVGYRFDQRKATRGGDVSPGPTPSRAPVPASRTGFLAAGTLIALITLASLTFRSAETGSAPPAKHPGFAMSGPINLTYRTGRETRPQLAPDGARFAYIRMGDRPELVVGDVGDPAQARTLVAPAIAVRWCPDGDHLAVMIPGDPPSLRIDVMDADGSNARQVGQTELLGSMEWTSDHSALVFADFQGERSINLFLQPLDDGAERTALLPLTEPVTRLEPRASPDGRYLSYREGVFPESRLVVVEFSGSGDEVYRSPPGQSVRSHDWSPDSQALYIAMEQGDQSGIWRLDLRPAPQEPRFVTATPALPFLSVSRDSGDIAYSTQRFGSGIALFESSSSGYQESMRIVSSEFDAQPVLSPSGKRLAFLSDRTGQWAVWIQRAMDAEARPLPLPGTALEVAPAWSPDSARLLVAFAADGAQALAVITVDAGDLEILQLPANTSIKALALAGDAALPVVSAAVEGQGTRVMARDGSSWRTLSTVDAPRLAVHSNAQQVLAAEASGYGLWAIDLDGGGQRRLDVPLNPTELRRWTVVDQGLMISRTSPGGISLERWRWSGDGAELVTEHRLAEGDSWSYLSSSWTGELVALDVRSGLEENIHMLSPILPPLLAER